MSTVQSIINTIQYRVDFNADLLHLVNEAIRIIGKRLYVRNSDLLKSEMSLSMYKERTYESTGIAFVNSNPDTITDSNSGLITKTETADTIAFVNGSPSTITDSGSGFVTAGFKVGMQIETDCVNNEGPFTLAGVAAGTLTLSTDEELVDTAAGTSYTITSLGFSSGMFFTTDSTTNPGPYQISTAVAGTLTLVASDSLTAANAADVTLTSVDAYVPLPSDFWGFCDKPSIDGRYRTLLPLPNVDTALVYSSAGESLFYKIKGSRLYLYPPPSDDITVVADYFAKPTEATALTDTVPWNEQFDDAISEIVVKLWGKSSAFDAEIEAICEKAVDIVAVKHGAQTPVATPGGISWDNL